MDVRINPLPNFANKKILPASYDDSLSYYELNAKVLSKTNEVVEQINKNTAEIDNMGEYLQTPHYRGAWDKTAEYYAFDVVLYEDGNSYTCIKPAKPGTLPTDAEHWALTGYSSAYAVELMKYCKSYDTVADMRADMLLSSGMICRTLGYHSSGDGGAAWYQIDATGVPNGMDCIQVGDGLYAKLVVTGPYVTPEMFGAYGNGTHDDGASFQGAFSSGHKVLVNGNYKISSPVMVTSDISVDFCKSTVVLDKDGRFNITGQVYFEFKGGKFVSQNGLNIFNVTGGEKFENELGGIFDGMYFATETPYSANFGISVKGRNGIAITKCSTDKIGGLYISKSINSSMSDCQLYGGKYGILDTSENAEPESAGLHIVNTTIIGNLCGIKVVSTDWVGIDNCMIDYNDRSVILVGQDGTFISNSYISTRTENAPVICVKDTNRHGDEFLDGTGSGEPNRNIKLANVQLVAHSGDNNAYLIDVKEGDGSMELVNCNFGYCISAYIHAPSADRICINGCDAIYQASTDVAIYKLDNDNDFGVIISNSTLFAYNVPKQGRRKDVMYLLGGVVAFSDYSSAGVITPGNTSINTGLTMRALRHFTYSTNVEARVTASLNENNALVLSLGSAAETNVQIDFHASECFM